MGAGMGVFFVITLLIWLGFLLSLNRLTDVVRKDSLPQTFINKIWVWSQIIPFWGFIALIVFNIKMDTAVRALESELKLPFKSIEYPATLAWIVILGALYTWIPIIGILILIFSMIFYWIKVSTTIRQIEFLRAN